MWTVNKMNWNTHDEGDERKAIAEKTEISKNGNKPQKRFVNKIFVVTNCIIYLWRWVRCLASLPGVMFSFTLTSHTYASGESDKICKSWCKYWNNIQCCVRFIIWFIRWLCEWMSYMISRKVISTAAVAAATLYYECAWNVYVWLWANVHYKP